MKINLTVSNEHHVKLVTSIVEDMRDSAFNDVTLVCSDGELRVNGLSLALLLPASYRSLHLGEGALLLLPQHNVQEVWPLVVPEGKEKVKEQKQEAMHNPYNIQLEEENIGTEPDMRKVKAFSETGNTEVIKFPDVQTELSGDYDEPEYGMDDSSDEDEEEEKEDRMPSITYIPKEEHMPQDELAKVTARYMAGSKSNVWMVINEQFIFHRKIETRGRTVSWTCSGTRKFGCQARAATNWMPREGASQPGAGCLVDLVWIWRNQLHTCNVDHSNYIFTMDLKNRIKQCWLNNPTLKYRTVFQESKAALISRIPSKDLRKRLRKECKMKQTWFYAWNNKLKEKKAQHKL